MTVPVRILDFGRNNLPGSYPDTPLIGPALVKDDLAANSFQFAPAGDVVTVAVPTFAANSDFAVAAYIVPFTSAQTCVVVGKLNGAYAAPFTFGLAGGYPSLTVANGTSAHATVVGTTIVPVGIPSEIIANYFRSVVTIYLNGVNVGSGTGIATADYGNPLKIGNINGLVSEVRLYNGALSQL